MASSTPSLAPASSATANAIWFSATAISTKPTTRSIAAATRQRLAYYASVNGNRSDLGLETPVAQIIHDADNGYGGFGSLIFNADPKNQLRLVVSRILPDPRRSVLNQLPVFPNG